MMGVITFGAGSANAHRIVVGAVQDDCLTLTRLWLSDKLPSNSESKIIGAALRAIGKLTSVKFLVTYADPDQGHVGTIYQATNWLYTGLSEGTPKYQIANGHPVHSRSFAHSWGTRSLRYLRSNGVTVTLVPQGRKHRYLYFIDHRWKTKLGVPVLPYPKLTAERGENYDGGN